MSLYYELKLQDSGSSSFLRFQMNKLARLHENWKECDSDALEAGHFPSISIIDAIGVSPYEIATLANQCRAACVVLWGVPRAVAGLSALPMRFSSRDLLAAVNGKVREIVHPEMHGEENSFTKVFPFNTIPLKLDVAAR